MYKKISLAVLAAAFSGMVLAGEEGMMESMKGAAGAAMDAAKEDVQKVAEAAKGSGMSALDTNQDGVISAEEAQANPDLAKSFESIDENKDGKIDAAEFAQFEAIQTPAPATPQEYK